jgi:hypothetical protein
MLSDTSATPISNSLLLSEVALNDVASDICRARPYHACCEELRACEMKVQRIAHLRGIGESVHGA